MSTTNIAWALVQTLRGDATLVALVGASARINIVKEADAAYPYLLVVPRGGYDQTRTTIRRVEIIAAADSDHRSTVESIHARIRTLLHDRTSYDLGDSPDTMRIVISSRVIPAEILLEDSQESPWVGSASYEFISTA